MHDGQKETDKVPELCCNIYTASAFLFVWQIEHSGTAVFHQVKHTQ